MEEFRRIRCVSVHLSATFNKFPSQVAPFALLHADRLGGDVVPCRVCAQTIKEWSLPSKIPIRKSAKTIRSKTPPEKVVAAKSGDQDGVLHDLVRSLIARTASPSPSPSAERVPQARRSVSPRSRVTTSSSHQGVARPNAGDVASDTDDDPNVEETNLVRRSDAPGAMSTIVPPVRIDVAKDLTEWTLR